MPSDRFLSSPENPGRIVLTPVSILLSYEYLMWISATFQCLPCGRRILVRRILDDVFEATVMFALPEGGYLDIYSTVLYDSLISDMDGTWLYRLTNEHKRERIRRPNKAIVAKLRTLDAWLRLIGIRYPAEHYSISI